MTRDKVFLSHSSKDTAAAKTLANDLRNIGFALWMDRFDIEHGDKFDVEIEKGLASTVVMLVYWTEAASASEWVRREVIKALSEYIVIIPLIFDDTPLSLPLVNVDFIDFRTGYISAFDALCQRLNPLVEDGVRPLPNASNQPWRYVSSGASPRIRYFYENNLLDITNPDFALNDYSRHLKFAGRDPIEHFVSFVAAPLANNVELDFDQLLSILQGPENNNMGIGDRESEDPAMWLDLNAIWNHRSLHNEYLFYRDNGANYDSLVRDTSHYLRVHRNGTLEWASTGYDHPADQDIHAFLLTPIVGSTWKFINGVAAFYHAHGYDGNFQLLINVRNTRGTGLGAFAKPSRYERDWHEYHFQADHYMRRIHPSEALSQSLNLQFAFDILGSSIRRHPELTQEIVRKLSHEIQRSYNLHPEDRHLTKNGSSFPWWYYGERMQYHLDR